MSAPEERDRMGFRALRLRLRFGGPAAIDVNESTERTELVSIEWESPEAEDRTAQAVGLIREAVAEIHGHYTDQTEWPGWDDDAAAACLVAEELLGMALPVVARRVGAT